jgi:hypothetical protein
LPCVLSSAGCARRQHPFKLIRSHIELKGNEDCNSRGSRILTNSFEIDNQN